jgi:uncharacterized protein YbbC (DUF1343 family)
MIINSNKDDIILGIRYVSSSCLVHLLWIFHPILYCPFFGKWKKNVKCQSLHCSNYQKQWRPTMFVRCLFGVCEEISKPHVTTVTKLWNALQSVAIFLSGKQDLGDGSSGETCMASHDSACANTVEGNWGMKNVWQGINRRREKRL